MLLCCKAMTTIKYGNNIFKSCLQLHKDLWLRHLAQGALEYEEAPPKETKRKIKSSKDVEQYMDSKAHLLKIKDKIPVRFLKKNRKAPDDLYLVDSYVAKQVADAIKPYVLKKNKTVIETNPGFGFITKELLKSGLESAQLYESTVCFRNHILNLNKEFSDKIKLYNRDFFSIWKLSYQDRHDNGDRVKRMLSNVEVKQWHQDPAMTIIGTTASSNFLRHLLLSLIFQFGVMTYGRCELFLIMPPYLYLQLSAGPEVGYLAYRASSVLFQIFCTNKILLKLPRKAFLPWDNVTDSKTKSKLWKFYSVDPDSMYLTRIEFKKDMPISMDKLQHLWYFIQHMMLSRSSRLIPSMEKWIPGCGIRLILNNSTTLKQTRNTPVYPDINIYTQSGQLTPDQFLNLFNEFSNWPEYSESPFIASMETALLKMESIQGMDDHNQEAQDDHVREVHDDHQEAQDDLEDDKHTDSIAQSNNIVDKS